MESRGERREGTSRRRGVRVRGNKLSVVAQRQRRPMNKAGSRAGLLEELFADQDKECIIRMKALNGEGSDCRIWRFTSNGAYTIRSAYRFVMEAMTNEAKLRVYGQWGNLWESEGPPKVKHFLWKAMRHVLSTRVAIRGRGMDVPVNCSLCDGEAETLEHLFLTCPISRRCWEVAGLSAKVEEFGSINNEFTAWIFRMLESEQMATQEANHGDFVEPLGGTESSFVAEGVSARRSDC
ncbi:hypothetical protein LINPERHAP1_LOCUS21372 [Linum perenne]